MKKYFTLVVLLVFILVGCNSNSKQSEVSGTPTLNLSVGTMSPWTGAFLHISYSNFPKGTNIAYDVRGPEGWNEYSLLHLSDITDDSGSGSFWFSKERIPMRTGLFSISTTIDGSVYESTVNLDSLETLGRTSVDVLFPDEDRTDENKDNTTVSWKPIEGAQQYLVKVYSNKSISDLYTTDTTSTYSGSFIDPDKSIGGLSVYVFAFSEIVTNQQINIDNINMSRSGVIYDFFR